MASVELVCCECGDDLACEGFAWCSDCLDALGSAEAPPDAQLRPATPDGLPERHTRPHVTSSDGRTHR